MKNIETPYHDNRELPTFNLRQIDLPEILKWQVDGEYYLVVKAKMVGINSMEYLEDKFDKTKKEAQFKMLSVEPMGDAESRSNEKKDFKSKVVQILSGKY